MTDIGLTLSSERMAIDRYSLLTIENARRYETVGTSGTASIAGIRISGTGITGTRAAIIVTG